MIPIKLSLRNFMCYREASLSFNGIHVACLCGDNGNGKSALLDAITWALWGRARARRDDELITLGDVEMWVELEFGLGPQRYRVWRQRSKKGRGQSDLHLYVWNPARDGEWRLLDEGNARRGRQPLTQGSGFDHLPDPADPRPVEQQIGTYFTRLRVGGVDFAILEDRKFKTGPNGPLQLKPKYSPRPDWVTNADYDPKALDLPGLQLLGARQGLKASRTATLAGDSAASQFEADKLACRTRPGNLAQSLGSDEILVEIDAPGQAGAERIGVFVQFATGKTKTLIGSVGLTYGVGAGSCRRIHLCTCGSAGKDNGCRC